MEGRQHPRRKVRLLRLIALATLALSVATTAAQPAYGDAIGVAFTDAGGVTHGASVDVQSAGSSSHGSSDDCTYTSLDLAPTDSVLDADGSRIAGDGTGAWYEKVCAGGTDYWGAVYVRPRQVNPEDLAAQARRYLALPAPVPRFSPADEQIVNVPTWMAIDSAASQPLQSSVSVPGVVVTVTAQPAEVVWDMGDGARVTCRPASDPQACSHTYRWPSVGQPDSAYRVTATVVWHANWTVSGAVGGGDLGTLSRSVTVPLRVGELQALNT